MSRLTVASYFSLTIFHDIESVCCKMYYQSILPDKRNMLATHFATKGSGKYQIQIQFYGGINELFKILCSRVKTRSR